jgi:1-deoxy-D-xylulose-5-phosphate reductoisomerase
MFADPIEAAAGVRRIVLLGATGSIGTQTLDVVARLGPERARIVGLAARGDNVKLLAEQARATGARYVAVTDAARGPALEDALAGTGATAGWGDDALEHLATLPEADTVVVAVAGAAALSATLAAARAGKRICIATKEVLVAAGALVTQAAREGGATILPIDSEHSAIFQCVQGLRSVPGDIARIYLTASGGPFRTWTAEQMARATVEDALNHPTWRMGGKITVDSATLMNKGLEIIEAAWLFGVSADDVEVVVHPQSVVHSFVETRDGALLAQMGLPDMRLPIQIALTHPEKTDTGLERLRPAQMRDLTFEPPDEARFPALGLARRAWQMGGTAPAALNAANEVAVAAFLDRRIGFSDICALVERALDAHAPRPADDLASVLQADRAARAVVTERVRNRVQS